MGRQLFFYIDDDEDDRRFFQEALKDDMSVTVLSFESFQEALEAARTSRPDRIYFDFWVPGMTATQFLRTLSDQMDISGIPLHLLSGTEVPPFFEELFDRYGVSYHLKPNSISDLRQLLRSTYGEEAF
ncbi:MULTISPECIES: response regulator [unclassified Flavobacterium]|uniref:response regulator n=1 Tax=unclassified Flavobacterium TaxID=196869 RepID=UPI001F1385E5|nr:MULTISPECIES: response regulator [unclassified Flavobacterium]UMY66155.1 response regulator [Flavobacterium sp. HJ-32-4]